MWESTTICPYAKPQQGGLGEPNSILGMRRPMLNNGGKREAQGPGTGSYGRQVTRSPKIWSYPSNQQGVHAMPNPSVCHAGPQKRARWADVCVCVLGRRKKGYNHKKLCLLPSWGSN